MINRSLKIIELVLLIGFIAAGCEQRQKKDIATIPDVNKIVVTADFASGAIAVTGGLQNWAKTQKVQFDSVVTLYQQDGSFYLTEHRYEIYPWSNSIRISAQEPLSKLVWQLSQGKFQMLEGNKSVDISPLAEYYRDFAEVILTITTAPVRFLDEPFAFSKVTTPVKMGGLWYYPITRTPDLRDKQKDVRPYESYWSRTVFYQNRDNSLVDIIWFIDLDEEKFLLVRGYDYIELEKKGVLFPTKIEISRTDIEGTFQQRLAEINVK